MTDLFSHAAQNTPPSEQGTEKTDQPLSISQFAFRLKSTLEKTFGTVCLEGEISNYRPSPSGHLYFMLKDEDAAIKGIIWRSAAARLKFLPEEGMQVIVRGQVTTYPVRSEYQITITSLEPAGQGALMQMLEDRRKKLAAEGFFDEDHKKRIPMLPKTIGMITSPTGAVIRDMLHRIQARCPRDVLLWPVLVQGPEAHSQIIRAIEGFNAMKEGRPDVLIIARGGGSLEDLWAFNEESLVRAVAASEIPVISGVGHEPDYTLCDFAADLRAPTPTAAAEMAVPVRADWLHTLYMHQNRMGQEINRRLETLADRMTLLARGIPTPQSQLNTAFQRLDDKILRLNRAMHMELRHKTQQFDALEKLYASLSPKAPLKRGYSYITGKNGQLVRSSKAPSGPITLHFVDGEREGELS